MKTLVVVDMQNDFINGSLGSNEAIQILSNVKELINKYVEEGNQIIFTRDTHFENYLDTQEGKKLPVVHCIKNTDGWQIPEILTENINDPLILDKPSFGSFKLVDLIEKDTEEIGLVGLCTDICVVSNAMILKAAFPEKTINVYKDCCAGVTPESHEKALDTMNMCQINII